jgi:hypothetical protein
MAWTGEHMGHVVGGFASKMVDAPKIHYLPQGWVIATSLWGIPAGTMWVRHWSHILAGVKWGLAIGGGWRGAATMPDPFKISDPYNRFKHVLDQCLGLLDVQSWQLPLHWVAMAPNGIILKGSYYESDEPDLRDTTKGEDFPEKFMTFPIHYLFVDSTGKGTHVVARSFSRIELLGCGWTRPLPRTDFQKPVIKLYLLPLAFWGKA